MSLERWSVFAAAELALCLTPGPAVLFVVSQALRFGGARSLWANAGIICGNTFYFCLSAAGLGALLMTSHELFVWIKWIGAVYLVYLGVSAFFERGAVDGSDSEFETQRAAQSAPIRGFRTLARGFGVQVSNPKALVFFTAFVPQFIDSHARIWPQILILGITSQVIEFLVLGGYGAVSGRASRLARRPRFARITSGISGSLLIGAGAGVALIRD
jgi:homoserine/homoserine lactone efflux protein